MGSRVDGTTDVEHDCASCPDPLKAACNTVGLLCLYVCALMIDSAKEGTVYGEGEKSFELKDGSTLDGVATTVVTISRINILNLCNTAVVGTAVCNVAVKGSAC